jgi:hypothetical protein
MADVKINSQIISSYDYDPTSLTLTVTFNTGRKWSYMLVYPNVVSQVFTEPGSIGSKFHKMIKSQGYRSMRVG